MLGRMPNSNLLSPQFTNDTKILGSLYGGSYALAAVEIAAQQSSVTLLVTDTILEASFLEEEIRFFAGNLPVYHLADWETLAYDLFSPHPDIISDRLRTLYAIAQLKHGIIIVAAQTLLQRLPPIDFIHSNTLIIETGQTLDSEALRRTLSNAGYINVTQVYEHGEFAIRGSVIDVFPMGNKYPIRIDLFDDEIESIHFFDTQTQRSEQQVQQVECLPAREFPFDKDAISQFRQAYRNTFEGNPQNSLVYTDISDGIASAGCEYYFPLFFNETATLFDYLPDNSKILLSHDWHNSISIHSTEIDSRYEQRRYDIERPILPPETLFLTPAELESQLQQYQVTSLQHYASDTELQQQADNAQVSKVPDLSLHKHGQNPSEKLQQFVKNHDGKVLFSSESPGRRENFINFLRNIDIQTSTQESWQDFFSC